MSDLVQRLRLPPFGTKTSERNLMSSAADEIEKLRKALMFYADPANYIDAHWPDGSTDGSDTPNAIPATCQEGAWVCDCGDAARAALGGKS